MMLVSGPLAGLVSGLMFGLAGGLVFGPGSGLGFGLMFGLLEWAEQPASTTIAITPQSIWNADKTLTLLRTSTFGLVSGLVFGLGSGLVFGPEFGLVVGLVVGLAAGVVLGNHHAWLAGGITIRRLARAGHVPRRLMAFLDDAHRLGLLRTVGPVYQFRHADLQDHLAALHFETDEPGRGR
ncbi:hypothetical protein F5972_33485 [Microbispora cellulosiformans]|uniref:Uncharacterized protein n=1 Tax=Microbispora cellulosiformans TaxID=2614688 RepID=A0A5J5JV47_9ACTN|nr:hypothetical protein [Microbispora cellulosiformans]KAA9373883.1 hypothetical protein F5972_33485 [Microbispora cellulosiformans]